MLPPPPSGLSPKSVAGEGRGRKQLPCAGEGKTSADKFIKHYLDFHESSSVMWLATCGQDFPSVVTALLFRQQFRLVDSPEV
jgi:hypothetical protein